MELIARLWRRLLGVLKVRRRDREMDTELQFHLVMEEADLIRGGMSPAEARRRARVAFGGVEQIKEEGRDARGGRWLHDLGRDVRSGLRGLRRSPGYSTVVILTLALGIGATATIFSAVNGVLLRRLPYTDPSRLFLLWDGLDWVGVPEAWLRGEDVIRLRQETTSFTGFAVVRRGSGALDDPKGGEPEQVDLTRTSAEFFDLLGTRPSLGRLFRPGEDVPGGPPVAVISHRLWTRRWGQDSSVIGRQIEVDGVSATVIGVLPRNFQFATQSSLGSPTIPDVYLPFTEPLASLPRGSHFLGVVARVKPTATVAAAKAELVTLGQRLDREVFASKGFKFVVISLQERLVRQVRPALITLLVAVGVLLAIMCANLATVVLARAASREREFTVRAALGAGGGRIAAQMLTETIVGATVGGILGLGLGQLGVIGLLRLAPAGLPRREEIGIDPTVVAFTFGVTLLAGILTGLIPARYAARRDASAVLRELSRSIGGSRSRGGLVLVQVALSTVLLAGTGLLLVSFAHLARLDPGFNADGVLTVELRTRARSYPTPAARRTFYRTAIERLAAIPGVRAAGGSSAPPLSANGDQISIAFPGSPTNTGQPTHDRVLIDWMVATPGYFEAMGIGVLAGREFLPTDDSASLGLIVDETVATRYFPAGNAIGQTLVFDGDSIRYSVLGVVRHARQYHLDSDDRGQVYGPYPIDPSGWMALAVKTDGDPAQLIPSVKEALRAIDPTQPVSRIVTMADVVGDSLAERRLMTVLVAGFAAVAMLLAAIGIYGVTAGAVTQRTREIGIRTALGADPRGLVWMVLRRPMGLVVGGLGAGLIAALILGRLMRGLLYQVAPSDPVTLAVVVTVLGGVAVVAGYLPARRAIRADPTTALRVD